MGKAKRTFDWSSATFKRFLIRIAYDGTNYHGLAWQEGTPTVEGELFDALTKTRLIKTRTECNFSRCGRTDKGVHAAGNVVSLLMRDGPLPYMKMLNNNLPPDVRVLSVREVPTHFDARFNCLYRVYKYFFVPSESMDINLLRDSAQRLVGLHDFRNFCKMDATKTSNFQRRILSITIEVHDAHVVATITGLSFLWHQIRCIMAILFLVAEKLESPTVIDDMLDVEKTPRKPIYELADPAGLVLFDCVFEGLHFEEKIPPTASKPLLAKQLELQRRQAVLACLAGEEVDARECAGVLGGCRSGYTPLHKRACCPSLEEKLEQIAKKVKNE